MAGTQVRRALQAAQRLSADCFLFWGGKDGYATPLNTDPARELRGYARLLRMTAGGFRPAGRDALSEHRVAA